VRHGDLLDLLLAARDPETGEALSNTEVRDQCGTMLAAGYETAARMLFWAAYLLTLDPAQQNRVRAEIRAFPLDRVTRLDDLLNWAGVRQTLLEALRLYPPAAHITREAIADDTVADEPVRPGTLIWISPWVLHRHRKFWVQPTAFMPERFASKPASWSNDGASCPLVLVHASALVRRSPWLKPRSCWPPSFRASGFHSMPLGQCFPSRA
jgi:cytochrome P450